MTSAKQNNDKIITSLSTTLSSMKQENNARFARVEGRIDERERIWSNTDKNRRNWTQQELIILRKSQRQLAGFSPNRPLKKRWKIFSRSDQETCSGRKSWRYAMSNKTEHTCFLAMKKTEKHRNGFLRLTKRQQSTSEQRTILFKSDLNPEERYLQKQLEYAKYFTNTSCEIPLNRIRSGRVQKQISVQGHHRDHNETWWNTQNSTNTRQYEGKSIRKWISGRQKQVRKIVSSHQKDNAKHDDGILRVVILETQLEEDAVPSRTQTVMCQWTFCKKSTYSDVPMWVLQQRRTSNAHHNDGNFHHQHDHHNDNTGRRRHSSSKKERKNGDNSETLTWYKKRKVLELRRSIRWAFQRTRRLQMGRRSSVRNMETRTKSDLGIKMWPF